MAIEKPTAPEVVPQWQLDLDQVGFVRRMFLARKWYGGDWWFVVVSAILLLFVIIVGIFPQWFAPYDPRAEVGPSLLAPRPAGSRLRVDRPPRVGDQVAARFQHHHPQHRLCRGQPGQPGAARSSRRA
ncbi:MAG TPA: hypothetical protein VHO48_11680, partial [Anaerolineaceae bacterium]|nr:hypothetical protein [Anaerolineaceae bacterium]